MESNVGYQYILVIDYLYYTNNCFKDIFYVKMYSWVFPSTN